VFKTKVLLVGLPIFAKKLGQDLQEIDDKRIYKVYNTYYSQLDKLLFLFALPFSSMVISLNGVSDKSGSLSWVLKFQKKLVMQWMGTDALLALERQEKKTIYRTYLDYATHFVDSIWQQEEIKSLGLPYHVVPFKYGREIKPIEKYAMISVLTYVAEKRKVFYGWEFVKKAALNFPEIQFRVAGFKHVDEEISPNIQLLGWLNDEEMIHELQQNPIFLRMSEHDGFSVTVIEALSVGSEVIWTHPSECVRLAKNEMEMNFQLTDAIESIKKREYTPNMHNIEFSKNTYSKEILLRNYLKKIEEISTK
jgi:glycosyltransferase involved in cell wall biosynthesis